MSGVNPFDSTFDSKVTVTLRDASMTTEQLPEPAHAPVHVDSRFPGVGVAVSVTCTPSEYVPLHTVPVHVIPAGLDVTVPEPTVVTVRVLGAGGLTPPPDVESELEPPHAPLSAAAMAATASSARRSND
jgi:hypothetical protein